MRYPAIKTVFENVEVQVSTLALLLDDFETQHGRFRDNATVKQKQIITLDEVLSLEEIFKKRAIEALDSKIVFKQHNGLSFLWILGQIDAELTAIKKRELVTDDLSLAKVLSYCTLHGSVTSGLITSKTWQVNPKDIEAFIDIDEAYQRIQIFVTTNDFLVLSEDEQINIVAFLLIMEKKGEEYPMGNYIVEEAIRKKLRELGNNN